jgi:hypothetical protein
MVALSGPAWRPDGSLITFLQHGDASTSLQMAILSEPVLVREMAGAESSVTGPVRWIDRMHLVFAAAGGIRARRFEDRRSRPLPFRAIVDAPPPRMPAEVIRKTLVVTDVPGERLVIRGTRLFDGVWSGYRQNMDVIIANGRIEAIESQADRDGVTLIDLGDITILPGLIDSWSALPDSLAGGAAVLAYGVTTIVAEPDAGIDASLWESEAQPGPRLLPAVSADSASPDARYFMAHLVSSTEALETQRELVEGWRAAGVPIAADSINAARATGADLVLGAASQSAAGLQAGPANDLTFISGLADGGNPAVLALGNARQAIDLGQKVEPGRRFSSPPRLAAGSMSIVAGSRQNRMPPGLALHAEFRALAASGLNGEQILHAAGSNAARVLGLDNQIGTLTPGALADLVLVSGDPLATPAEMQRIVAVVRNGRFFSLVNLLERARPPANVE